MRFGTAIERLVDNYRYASDKEWIRDKVAWALYHTWKEADRKTKQMANDLIRKSDVLETYADLYDIFDDNKTIQEELHKVFDKMNNIPVVESSNSEKPNNSTISKMEQVDEPQEVCDRPQKDCENCWKELHCRAKERKE